MKLNNPVQIKSEDYDKDYQNLVDQLAETLNPFMVEVYDLSDSRIDFENRVEAIKTIEIEVDSSGAPKLNSKVNTGKASNTIRGTQVINTYNLTNSKGYPTSQPYINFMILAGGFIQIDSITGLLPNNKYQVTFIIY